MSDSLPDDVLEQIRQALFRGSKIGAIKIYREYIPSHLAEAKTAIDQLEQQLRATEPEKFSAPPGGQGCSVSAGVMVLAAMVIIGICAYA